nr:immunoglobulin heavy chain junction region [Mus musculus]MBK4184110.1 immunoglobulin heavy chain junction region [Mus musculus]MBK4184114.1 immunoglobulin heavy chain junction region [Mus musculus]MBK4186413.1 immunoglobulin heavy chain junction region [Mus musculus]
CARRPFDFW